jgi:hypothetical protein
LVKCLYQEFEEFVMKIRVRSKNDVLTGFRYFWGKTVTGFDNKVHCAKCLLGEYDEQVKADMPANTDIEIPLDEGAVFYLCGVAIPYKWANNAHLALKVKAGATAELPLYTGDKISVEGAEKIPFDGKKALDRYSHLSKAYTTCRNFQFGVSYFETGEPEQPCLDKDLFYN